MRNLVYKNLTSAEKKRRIISTTEVGETQGVHSVIRRHFVYMVRQVTGQEEAIAPQIRVIKERNRRLHEERFYCKVKGMVFAVHNEKRFKVTFIHSLRISLSAVKEIELNSNNS
jgi:hypothetical protein